MRMITGPSPRHILFQDSTQLVEPDQLTVLDGDPTFTVLCPQRRLVAPSLLDHRAHSALAVWAVVRWVMSQLETRLVRCRTRGNVFIDTCLHLDDGWMHHFGPD